MKRQRPLGALLLLTAQLSLVTSPGFAAYAPSRVSGANALRTVLTPAERTDPRDQGQLPSVPGIGSGAGSQCSYPATPSSSPGSASAGTHHTNTGAPK